MSPPHPDDVNIYDRDFSLLVDMGCNSIRTWSLPPTPWDDDPPPVGDPPYYDDPRIFDNMFDKAHEYGIKVIAGAEHSTAMTLHSRCVSKSFTYPSPLKQPNKFIDCRRIFANGLQISRRCQEGQGDAGYRTSQ